MADHLILPGEPSESDIPNKDNQADTINCMTTATDLINNMCVHDMEDDMECCLTMEVVATLSSIPVVLWNDICIATASDPVCQSLEQYIESRFPQDKQTLNPKL